MGDLKNIFDYLQLLLRYFVAGVVSILVIAFTDDTAMHFFYSLIQKSPYILLFIAATVGIILTAIHHAILDDFFFEISIRCYLLKHKMPEKLEKSSRDWSKSSIKKSNSKTTSSFKFSLYSQTYLRRRSSNFDILSLENELKFKWSFLNLLYCSTYSMLLIPILIWKVRTYQNFHSIHSFRIGFDLLSGVVLLIAALKYDYRITKREIWIAEYFFQTTDAIHYRPTNFQ